MFALKRCGCDLIQKNLQLDLNFVENANHLVSAYEGHVQVQ